MNHIWQDPFGNFWRTPVDWGDYPKPRPAPVVYVEPRRGYYARYDGRKLTHSFELEDPMSPEDVELFRREPEMFFMEAV